MLGINNAGSGGGKSNSNALLHITAEVGSTITLKKNGITIKVLPASKGFPVNDYVKDYNTDHDSGIADYYYSVTPTNFGTWVVEASLNGTIVTDSVIVDSNKQYEVYLQYKRYIFKDGLTRRHDWIRVGRALESFHITNELYVDANTGSGYSGLISSPAFDITNYESVGVYSKGAYENGALVYISQTVSVNMVRSVDVRYAGTHSIDVSDLTGEYYVGFACQYNNYGSISQVWFSRV